MTTESIYTIGQLKGYITGRLQALNAQPVPPALSTSAAMDAGRANAYADILAHIVGIEAHEAAKAAPASTSLHDMLAHDGGHMVQGLTQQGGCNEV